MKYWIVMFGDDTYELVKKHQTIGVTASHGKRFAEIENGDRFIVYVSRKCLLDGRGEFTSDPFISETPIFGERRHYPHRCKVRFDRVGMARDAKGLLWGLSPFSKMTMKTVPANYIFLKGGFMEIAASDFEWLSSVLEGHDAYQPRGPEVTVTDSNTKT